MMNNARVRARVYEQYNSARRHPLTPRSIDDLKSRGPYWRRLITRHFPASLDAEILDVGCGHGTGIYFARRAGYRNVRGVDISHQQVEAARRLGIPGVEQADVLTALRELPGESLDVVVAFDLLEHLTRSEIDELLEHVHRALKPGGKLIVHTINGASPFFGRVRYGDFTHEEAFTESSISQVFLANGFANVECFEDEPIVHGVKSAIRLVAWRVLRLAWRFCVAIETGSTSDRIFSQNFLAISTK